MCEDPNVTAAGTIALQCIALYCIVLLDQALFLYTHAHTTHCFLAVSGVAAAGMVIWIVTVTAPLLVALGNLATLMLGCIL